MKVYAIDHVQLAMPPNQEEPARAFYRDILELVEIPKPPELAKRGGVWFEQGTVTIHLGVEQDFRPAKKAHPALLVDDLEAGRLASSLSEEKWLLCAPQTYAGIDVIAGVRRTRRCSLLMSTQVKPSNMQLSEEVGSGAKSCCHILTIQKRQRRRGPQGRARRRWKPV